MTVPVAWRVAELLRFVTLWAGGSVLRDDWRRTALRGPGIGVGPGRDQDGPAVCTWAKVGDGSRVGRFVRNRPGAGTRSLETVMMDWSLSNRPGRFRRPVRAGAPTGWHRRAGGTNLASVGEQQHAVAAARNRPRCIPLDVSSITSTPVRVAYTRATCSPSSVTTHRPLRLSLMFCGSDGMSTVQPSLPSKTTFSSTPLVVSQITNAPLGSSARARGFRSERSCRASFWPLAMSQISAVRSWYSTTPGRCRWW